MHPAISRRPALAIVRHRDAVRPDLRAIVPLLVLLLTVLAGCGTNRVSEAGPVPTPTIPLPAAPQQRSYAALGASETFGIGATPNTDGYAYLVRRALHATHFVDAGIPGATLNQAYQSELDRALAIRPELCTVLFGVNDLRAGVTRKAFMQDLHDFVATLRQSGAQVVIIGLPNLAELPAVQRQGFGGLDQITRSWNAGMQRVADETGAHFLDLTAFSRELASHPSYISSDGLHPSNAGHRRLAQVLLATIRKDHLWPKP